MDVKQYYRKLREVESAIKEPYVLVTSLETSDGGKPGIISEVTREQAARLIVESKVVLSSEIEEKAFLVKRIADKRTIEKADAARRLQVTIVSAPDETDLKAVPSASSDTGSRK